MKGLSFRLVTVRVRCKKDDRWHEVGASAWSVHASQAEPPPVYLLDILLRVRPGAVIMLTSSGPDIVLQYFNALVYPWTSPAITRSYFRHVPFGGRIDGTRRRNPARRYRRI